MMDKEILLEAIKKYYTIASKISIIKTKYGYRVDVYLVDLTFPTISMPVECIIFSHAFAKAFFGEKPVDVKCDVCGNFMPQLAYAFHLQQMVLEEEPIKYLKKFL